MANKMENIMLMENLVENAIGDLYLFDAETGLEYASTTLASSELASTSDAEEVKGGTSNSTIYTIAKSKEMTFTVTDVLNDEGLVSRKNGGVLSKVGVDTVYAFHMPKFYEVTINSTKAEVTLDKEPANGEKPSVYVMNTKTTVADTNVTISGAKVEIDNSTLNLQAGDKVRIMGYKYKAPEDALYTKISGEATTVAFYGVYKLPIFDTDMNVRYYKTYIFPKLTMKSDYTVSNSTERTAVSAQTDFTIALAEGETELGYIVYEKVTA